MINYSKLAVDEEQIKAALEILVGREVDFTIEKSQGKDVWDIFSATCAAYDLEEFNTVLDAAIAAKSHYIESLLVEYINHEFSQALKVQTSATSKGRMGAAKKAPKSPKAVVAPSDKPQRATPAFSSARSIKNKVTVNGTPFNSVPDAFTKFGFPWNEMGKFRIKLKAERACVYVYNGVEYNFAIA